MKIIPIWIWRLLFLVIFIYVWELASQKGYLNPILVGCPSGIFDFLISGLFKRPRDSRAPYRDTIEHSHRLRCGKLSWDSCRVAIRKLSRRREIFRSTVCRPQRVTAHCSGAPVSSLVWTRDQLQDRTGISLTFFIVLSSTIAGARGVSADHIVLSRTIGTSSLQTFTRITLPSAIPTIFSGLRLGLIYALLGVIGGEIIAAQKA